MLQTSALWPWRLPRGLERASHVLGRALWHALALTDASPAHTSFAAPPEKTSAPASPYLHRRHVTFFWGIRERDWVRDLQARGERPGGGWRSKRNGVFKANARGCHK